jgi:N-succinyldiaminopimelate aminotransferase
MRLSPVLAEMATYPFVRLEEAKRAARARGVKLIDFGVGDPREATDPMIRQALVDAVGERLGYPLSVGLPELRSAIAGWLGRRFGARIDPETEVIPTLGSKEAIFSFAQLMIDRSSAKRVVAVTEPGYPVQERGALFAGGEVRTVPLLAGHDFLPDLDAIDFWDRIALFWVNYPNNPTGATAPVAFYEELAERARAHDFLLCSDEAYSEIWFDEPPASALQVSDRSNVVVFNTLSKRSSMTGYRSGFVAAPAEVIKALRKFRPTVGTAPQEFVQRASIVAWNDEAHVERTREIYRRKRALIEPALRERGIRLAGSRATFFLWLAVPELELAEEFVARLLEHGIVVAPGSFFGPAGEDYARLALVPSEEECARAAEILKEVL